MNMFKEWQGWIQWGCVLMLTLVLAFGDKRYITAEIYERDKRDEKELRARTEKLEMAVVLLQEKLTTDTRQEKALEDHENRLRHLEAKR